MKHLWGNMDNRQYEGNGYNQLSYSSVDLLTEVSCSFGPMRTMKVFCAGRKKRKMKKLTRATLQTIKLKVQNYSSKVSIYFRASLENKQDSSVLIKKYKYKWYEWPIYFLSVLLLLKWLEMHPSGSLGCLCETIFPKYCINILKRKCKISRLEKKNILLILVTKD